MQSNLIQKIFFVGMLYNWSFYHPGPIIQQSFNVKEITPTMALSPSNLFLPPPLVRDLCTLSTLLCRKCCIDRKCLGIDEKYMKPLIWMICHWLSVPMTHKYRWETYQRNSNCHTVLHLLLFSLLLLFYIDARNVFCKKLAIPASFCLFSVFRNTQNIFYNKSMWKNVHPISGAGIWTHKHESAPITTIPGLAPNSRRHCG